MTKKDLILKWEKRKSFSEGAYDIGKDNLSSQENKILKGILSIFDEIIEDIKNLNEATVKLREACSKNTQHDDMKSANWKYCSECGKKL